MSNDEEQLALVYLATIQALAYGTRHILDSLKSSGRPLFSSLLICGGLSKNRVFVETHAEACALPVLCPDEQEMVLVGAAILGACAAKYYPNLQVNQFDNIRYSFVFILFILSSDCFNDNGKQWKCYSSKFKQSTIS